MSERAGELLERIYKKGLTGVAINDLKSERDEVQFLLDAGFIFRFGKANMPGSRFQRVKITDEGKAFLGKVRQ